MTRIKQGAFNAGIISEGMYAREDTEKFQKGLKDALNVILRPQGGVTNRAGTMTATGCDTSGAEYSQWLIPFSFNTEQNYELEFAEGVFRVIKDGAYVLDTSVAAAPVTSIAGDPATITLTDVGDAAGFPSGVLAYLSAPNGDHALHESVVRVTAVAGAALTIEGGDGATFDADTGDWGTLGAGATLQPIYQQTHPYALEHVYQVRFAQDADTLFLAHELYPPKQVQRTAHDNWTVSDVVFSETVTPPLMGGVAVVNRNITNIARTNPMRVTLAGTGPDIEGVQVRISGVNGMTGVNGNVYVVTNYNGSDAFDLYDTAGNPVDGFYIADGGEAGPQTYYNFDPYTSGGVANSVSAGVVYGPDVNTAELREYEYVVASIDEDGVEGLPGDPVTVENDLAYRGSINTIVWSAAADAARYNVYRRDAGAYGYIGTTTSLSFDDENITPDVSRGVQIQRNPFDAPGNYPAIVTFYEQRLAFGRTINDPQVVEVSRIDNVKVFNSAYPSLPDDAFRFRLRAQQVNAIRAFIPNDVLAILTSGAEWEIAAQGDGEYQRPDKRKLAPMTYFGSCNLEPVLVGATALFLETSGNVIRDYRLGDRSNIPGDLTILARDLFEGKRVTSWTYARSPHGVLWVTLDTGELLSMTYITEHDVWGWTRHEIGGADAKVAQVSAIREGDVDTVYLVVSRTINGRTVTLTERMAQREDLDVAKAYFVDGGYRFSYDAAASRVSGLLHLRGETVTVLIDGDAYIDAYTVDATGTVDLAPLTGRDISVGLSYESLVETLDVNFDVRGTGNTEGTYRSAAEISVKMSRSRAVEVGTHLDRMTRQKEWNPGLIGGPLPLRSGTEVLTVDGDWVRNATTYVRQRYPLPMTVTAITPDWEFGG